MKKFESYSSVMPWLMALVLSVLAACGGGGGGREPVLGVGSNATANGPNVINTNPLARTPMVTGVATNTKVTAYFDKDMDAATLTTTTFTLACPAGTAIGGGVVYLPSSRVAVFTPNAALPISTTCTATITTGAKDATGVALASAFVWQFQTGLVADVTAPLVISSGAADGDTNLPINRSATVTFNEPMDPQTITSPATSFTVVETDAAGTLIGPAVAGTVTYNGNTATFSPSSNLKANTWYKSTVSAAAKDLAGIALVVPAVAPNRKNPWHWQTGGATDTTAPTITLTSPVNGAASVALNQSVNATFSKEMKQSTMVPANFNLKETATNVIVPGLFAYDVQQQVASFVPQANLKPNTSYTATVTNGAQDLAGNALVVPAVNGLPTPNPWTFTTAAAGVLQPLAINLGRAASFGIASRAGLTSTGVTVVNGDVALYPTPTCTDSTGNGGASQPCLVKTYSSPTGLTVNGSVYWAGDPFDSGATALAVTSDLNAAWVEGKAKVPTKPTVAGDQLASATPYLAGVYHNATLGLQAGGIATLDAQGDPNAIFIFQVDSSFVDSGTLLLPSQIRLVNGAQARNVWFVAGLDITIGSGTSWNGNILAGRSATVNHGSTLIGRVLAGASGAGAFVLTGAASPVTTITVPQ